MADTAARPLSPHLGIWRWRLHMLISISHRATGTASLAGAVVIVWGLVALASGPDYFNTFMACASSMLGRLVLFGLTLAFMLHLCTGVRHLIMDTGAGLSLAANRQLNMAVPVAAVVLTLAAWFAAYFL